MADVMEGINIRRMFFLRKGISTFRHISLGLIKRLKLTFDGRIVTIPTELISDEYGFSFAPKGWHYFRELIAEYEQNPDICLDDTNFFKFFQHEKVRTIRYVNDLLFLHKPSKILQQEDFKFYFCTVPWGDWTKSCETEPTWGYYHDLIEGKMTRNLYGFRRNPWYQPGDRYPLEIEFNHFKYLYNSIKDKGYSPLRFGSLPEVILLIRSSGEWRAVRSDGHHRLTILSHLGYEKVTVSIPPQTIGVIYESEVEQWYYVKRGLCNPGQALEIFNAFFELNGRERLEYLGLSSVY
jgi:hypothetical protein